MGQWHKKKACYGERHFTANWFVCTVSVVQENVGQLFTLERGRGLRLSGVHSARLEHNELNSTLPSSWPFVLPRLLGRAEAKWKHGEPGRADQSSGDIRCGPNKRECWHESNSADLGRCAREWWNPDWRTGACALVLLYPQWRYGKDSPGCTTWIQPEQFLL